MLAAFENSERNSHISRIVIITSVAMTEYRDHIHCQAIGTVTEFVQAFGPFTKTVATINSVNGKIQQ